PRPLLSLPTRRSSDLLGGGADAQLDAVGDGHDLGAALASDLHAGTGCLPPADAHLYEVLGGDVGDVGGVVPGGGVHPLVEVGFLDRKSTRLNSSHQII